MLWIDLSEKFHDLPKHKISMNEFNSMTPKLEFTLEEEQNEKINFTIVKTHKGLSFDIYRKPTTTDLIIPKDSCHPFEQKTAAIRSHRDRLQTVPRVQRERKRDHKTNPGQQQI